MPLLRVQQCGAVGVNRDLSSHELPPNAWTDARNVRFLDGSAYQFYGHGEVYKDAPVVPFHVSPANVAGARYWLYASAAKIYAVSAASGSVVHTNLTRQTGGVDVDYSGVRNAWTSTLLSGIPVFNAGNLTDPPQQWDLNLANRFKVLDNWPTNCFARSLRAYRNQLVALNVTKAGVRYPYMVKWSHPADPGTVPISWDPANPALDAGEVDLAEGQDPIVDGLQLRDSFIIYKENSVWRMNYAGGVFVENFTKVLGMSGAMNRNCIVELDGFHLVLTGFDVVIHDGQSAKSVLDKKTRRDLFKAIDAQSYAACFVFKNPFLNETFICFPTDGASIPNRALVYNYVDGTCAFRDIPSLNHAAFGPVETGLSQPWDGDSSPWASDITSWNQSEFTPDTARVLMASNNQQLLLLDSSTTFNGVIPSAFMERRGLNMGSPETRKCITSIRPRVMGSAGETIMVQAGGADDPYTDPVFSAPVPYTIGQTKPTVDIFFDSRFPAVRFSSGSAYQWRLDDYDIEFKNSGAW